MQMGILVGVKHHWKATRKQSKGAWTLGLSDMLALKQSEILLDIQSTVVRDITKANDIKVRLNTYGRCAGELVSTVADQFS
jgi:hypothetical protein